MSRHIKPVDIGHWEHLKGRWVVRHRYDKYRHIKTCFSDKLRVICVPKDMVENTINHASDGLESRIIAKDILFKIQQHFSERECEILHMYYVKQYKMKRIGGIMGISEARVSQIHSDTIKEIREKWSL